MSILKSAVDLTGDKSKLNIMERSKPPRKRGPSKESFSRLNSPARVRRRAKMDAKPRASVFILSPRSSVNDSCPPFPGNDDFKLIKAKSKSEISSSTNLRNSLKLEKSACSVRPTSLLVFKNTPKKNTSSDSVDNALTSKISLSDKISESSNGSGDTPYKSLDRYDTKESRIAIKQVKKLKTLATLLPDELIQDPTGRKPRPYNTALMFPDVSGFTQLCEKYDKTGQGGPSRLTEVLNGYIGSMIQIVLSRDGDVCKFGGDAFLCVWKVPFNSDLKDIVHLAIESAVDIQKRCGEHKTDVGVKLGVKIAVAAGRALFSIIGTENRKHYVIVGPPILDVKDAEKFCKPGDVIVAPSAWKYVENYTLYSYTYHPDGNYIKVHDFGPLWKSAKPFFRKVTDSMHSLCARPFLRRFTNLKVEEIRPFILPPVMKSIDLNQSLDYLTEMRQVAIVFINVAAEFKNMRLEDWTELCNQAFQIATGIADKNDGAVNKLTLFDKDMAILVVFGLKGFKHELASQVALKYAYNILAQLKKLKTVTSVSVGVTTGMAYCGVIGHTLRREYTVMGHPVNMAARLMCAYLNMVSADRETFLHSKLESGHFELLEQKYLKGIKNPGPFYKFHLHPRRTKVKLDYQAYPILGRKKEIQEFERWLANSKANHTTTNFMVIFGEARIGKSRLVAKLINITQKSQSSEDNLSDTEVPKRSRRRDNPDRIDIWVIPLTEDDSKSSYSTVKLIFQPALGLRDSSSIEEREDKILSKLGEMRDFYMLASLNPIFNVNFDLMPQYLTLSQPEQTRITEVMVKNLYKKCFPKGARWLIVIEDAEFIDEESWSVMKCCSTQSLSVLYLLTIGQHKTLSAAAIKCLEFLKPKKITLGYLEKWYFAGLACQILGVRAIPAELVNLMQMHKNCGNPGWLESFLLSLLQSGSIYIDQASSHKIKNMRLITVPDEMLSSSKEISTSKDTSYWVDCVENFENLNDTDNNVSVCLLGPSFFVSTDSEAELTMDLMLIKTIDTLKPLEQTVLKTSSVLGNNFKRNMLKYVISKELVMEERVFAKAIRNLFEIKILTCAKGDLTQTNLLAPRRMILVQSMKKEVTCECNGVVISEDCKDLPLYASCGYMQFRSPNCRETVYNLLLDDQKKKYHSYSIEFLRKNTFKCKYCNGLPFTSVFGEGSDDQVTLVCTITPMHGVRSTCLDPNNNTPIAPRAIKTQPFFRNFSRFSKGTSVDSKLDVGAASDIEVGDCHCSEILTSVYSVLLEHAAGSGKKDVMLEVQLEYASISLTNYNFPLTNQILEDALALVNQMREEKEYLEFCSPYIYGKIYTLMGATKLGIGRPDDSLEYLEKSLTYLKCRISKNSAAVKSLIRKENIKLQMLISGHYKRLLGKSEGRRAINCDLLAECLGFMSIVYMEQSLNFLGAWEWMPSPLPTIMS